MIDKILIQLPDDKDEVISILPFLMSLNNHYPNSEKNIFMIEDNSQYLEILPFKKKIYLIPEEIFQSSLLIHKYCANLNEVFNIDLSISLNLNWKSALLGFGFRSRNRLGVKSFRASPFLTHSLKMYNNEPLASFADRLLSKFSKTTIQSKKIELPGYEIDDENFGQLKIFTFFMRESNLQLKGFEESFSELSEIFDGHKFKIFCQNHIEGNEVNLKINANKKNYYEIKTDSLTIEKSLQKASYSDLLFTDDSLIASLSESLETPCVYFGAIGNVKNHDFLIQSPLHPDGQFDVEKLETDIKHFLD